jgi:hypothetical protein
VTEIVASSASSSVCPAFERLLLLTIFTKIGRLIDRFSRKMANDYT